MAKEISSDDVVDLYKVGAVKLPLAADQFASAASEVNTSSIGSSGAFGGGLGVSPVSAPWSGLRDLVQDHILVRSRDALVKSGEVVANLATAFAEDDKESRDKLDAVKKEHETGKDSDGNPINEDELPRDVPEAPISGNEDTDPYDKDNDREKPDVDTTPGKGGNPDGDPIGDKPGGGTPWGELPQDKPAEDDK